MEYDACAWLSAIGATMRISLFQQLSLFLDIIARSSHVCRSATHSPVGEAPLRPSRQNQVYVTASFSGMTCRGRFYVVGPPVQSAHAVEDLVSYVMRETPDLKTANFVLNDLEGPVRYDSTWVPGGRQQEIRYGPGVAELWTVWCCGLMHARRGPFQSSSWMRSI